MGLSSAGATAAPEDDKRLVFDQFVKAQNSHDAIAVGAFSGGLRHMARVEHDLDYRADEA